MFEKMVLMYTAYTLVIAAAVSYGIYKLIRPKGKPTSAKQYGQLWAAWVLAFTNITSLPKFLSHLDVNTFAVWLANIIFLGGISFLVGCLYGKLKIMLSMPLTKKNRKQKPLEALKTLSENDLIPQEDYDKKKQILNDI